MQSVAIDILYQFPDITGTCCFVTRSIIERIFGWLIAYHGQHLPSTGQNIPYSLQNCLWGSEINNKTYSCPYNVSQSKLRLCWVPMYNLSPCSVLRMQQSVRQTRMSELTKLLSVLLFFMFYLSFETNKKAGFELKLSFIRTELVLQCTCPYCSIFLARPLVFVASTLLCSSTELSWIWLRHKLHKHHLDLVFALNSIKTIL